MRVEFPAWLKSRKEVFQIINYEGAYVKIRSIRNTGSCSNVGGSRGSVVSFSPASRRRCLLALMSIDYEGFEGWRFITLTVPASLLFDPVEFRKAFKRFQMSFFRRFGKCGMVWKIEFQDNGQPHLHMLANRRLLRAHYLVVARLWTNALVYGRDVGAELIEKIIKASSSVERIKKPDGALAYFVNYMGKVEQNTFPEGWSGFRVWGILNKDLITYRPKNQFIQKNEFLIYKMVDDISSHVSIPECRTLFADDSDFYLKIENEVKTWLDITKNADSFADSVAASMVDSVAFGAIPLPVDQSPFGLLSPE